MSLRLFVIRHGVTQWGRERRFAGSRDIPLGEDGKRQCEAVAQALAGAGVTAVYASPLERARASAEIIAAPYRLEVRIEPAFREMGYGEWEGRTRDEIAARFPRDYQAWSTTPDRFTPPGGEALDAVAARVSAGIDELKAEHDGESVVLVTHAVVARLAVLAVLGLGPARLGTVDVSPGGITEIEYREDWMTLHRMNTVSHLSAVETPA